MFALPNLLISDSQPSLKSLVVLSSTPRGCLSFKMPGPGVDQFICHIDPGVDTPEFLSDIIISSTFGSCALDFPWFMTFTSGPQSQPIRFQSQFQVATSPPLGQRNFLYFFHVSCFPVGTLIHSKLSIKTAAFPLLKIARLFPCLFFLVYRLSIVPSMTHRMLSHLALVFSHS